MEKKWNSELVTFKLTKEEKKTVLRGTSNSDETKPEKVRTTSGGTTTESDLYE